MALKQFSQGVGEDQLVGGVRPQPDHRTATGINRVGASIQGAVGGLDQLGGDRRIDLNQLGDPLCITDPILQRPADTHRHFRQAGQLQTVAIQITEQLFGELILEVTGFALGITAHLVALNLVEGRVMESGDILQIGGVDHQVAHRGEAGHPILAGA